MKIGFGSVNIDPKSPAQTVGYLVDKPDATYVKDGLFARGVRISDGATDVFVIVLDSLGMTDATLNRFKKAIAEEIGGKTEVLLCATHTHLAPSLCEMFGAIFINEEYAEFVEGRLRELARSIKPNEAALGAGYAFEPYNKVGTTRISDKDDKNVYAATLCLYDGEKRIGTILFYNCHPTIPAEESDFFTSDYPGRAIRELEKQYPGEFFMFLQGADGDVSTRFTRREKTYSEVERLGDLIAEEFSSLMRKATPSPVGTISFNSERLTVKNQLKSLPPMSDEQARAAMSEKEFREFMQGKTMLKHLSRMMLPEHTQVTVSRLSIGGYRLIFNPYELFTDYNGLIDMGDTLLVCYCGNLASYLSGPNNNKISYETLIEFQTEDDKKNLVELIKRI